VHALHRHKRFQPSLTEFADRDVLPRDDEVPSFSCGFVLCGFFSGADSGCRSSADRLFEHRFNSVTNRSGGVDCDETALPSIC